MIESSIVLSGNIVKKNFLGTQQVRLFEMNKDGEVKYYDTSNNKKTYKKSFWVDGNTVIEQTKPDEFKIKCAQKNKNMTLKSTLDYPL